MPHKFLFTFILASALLACKQHSTAKQYHLDGVVVSLDAQGQIAKINAQKIDGWMEAMTMEYPVKDHREFAALRVGDHIIATVYVEDLNYSIGQIQKREGSR